MLLHSLENITIGIRIFENLYRPNLSFVFIIHAVILSQSLHSPPILSLLTVLDVKLPAQLVATTEYVYTPVTSLSVYAVVVLGTFAIKMLSRYIEYDVIALSLTGIDPVKMIEQLVSV